MNLAQFNISISDTGALLEQLKFLKMKGVKSVCNDGVSQEFKNESLKADYWKTYTVGKKNFDFDFLLFDESYFQFSCTFKEADLIPDIRYSFYQNPTFYTSYEEYIEQLRTDGIIESESVEEVGEVFLEEYDQFLLESQLNVGSTTIRYDVDAENYNPLIHSISHFHIGHNNDVRIPCNKVISPLKFVLFVLKHIYYYQWKESIQTKNTALLTALDSAKSTCMMLLPPSWVAIEEKELFLQ